MNIPGPLPLACPDARLSPVFVGDVAQAFANALEDRQTFGRRYELCGPESYTLEQLVRFVAQHTGRHKLIIRLPDWASRLQASMLQYFPGKPFTPDNYDSLRTPSVCNEDGLAALGVTPTSLENAGIRFLQKTDKNKRRNSLRQISQR
jgi:NADH dehydrogenase